MKARWTWPLAVVAGLALMVFGVQGPWQTEAAPAEAAPVEGAARASGAGADGFAGTVAVVGVRLFDGTRVLPKATVVFTGGKIVAVGAEVPVPDGATVVDGTGKTLLPGLIDSHTHSWGTALERAVVFGVTTQIDMFTEPGFMAAKHQEQASGKPLRRADLVSAGVLATAPGGHGTQFGVPIPTLTGPSDADGWVAERVEQGSDFIKLVLEDGALFGREIPTLDRATLEAVLAAAKKRGLLTVTHVHTLASARMAIESGSDGLAHLFLDGPADAALVKLAAERGVFVVPTMTVLESATGTASGLSLITDARLAPFLTSDEIRGLSTGFPDHGLKLDVASRTVASLHAAGVPILAGSDAPNPGTTHGASMHRELELLVAAGLSPLEALAAATSVPADTFGLDDRGRIAPGLLADLVLVDGDPTSDVTATRSIVAVWKRGVPIERHEISAREREEAQALRTEARPRREVGAIADFETGVGAEYGFGWTPSSDQFMGGTSTVALDWLQPGAGGSAGALRIGGEIKPGYAFPWSGAMFFPGSAPMAAVDLSGATALTFDLRGPGPVRVMFFAESLGQIPGRHELQAGAEWQRVRIELATVPGLKLEGLQAFLISTAATSGEFELQVDNVALE